MEKRSFIRLQKPAPNPAPGPTPNPAPRPTPAKEGTGPAPPPAETSPTPAETSPTPAETSPTSEQKPKEWGKPTNMQAKESSLAKHKATSDENDMDRNILFKQFFYLDLGFCQHLCTTSNLNENNIVAKFEEQKTSRTPYTNAIPCKTPLAKELFDKVTKEISILRDQEDALLEDFISEQNENEKPAKKERLKMFRQTGAWDAFKQKLPGIFKEASLKLAMEEAKKRT